MERKLIKVNTAIAKLANRHSLAVRQDTEVCLSLVEQASPPFLAVRGRNLRRAPPQSGLLSVLRNSKLNAHAGPSFATAHSLPS